MRKQSLMKAEAATLHLIGWYNSMGYDVPDDVQDVLEAVQYCLSLED